MEFADATIKSALTYVRNTNGGATIGHFISDHEPVGYVIWTELAKRGLAGANAASNNRIFVTEAGKKFLSEHP